MYQSTRPYVIQTTSLCVIVNALCFLFPFEIQAFYYFTSGPGNPDGQEYSFLFA